MRTEPGAAGFEERRWGSDSGLFERGSQVRCCLQGPLGQRGAEEKSDSFKTAQVSKTWGWGVRAGGSGLALEARVAPLHTFEHLSSLSGHLRALVSLSQAPRTVSRRHSGDASDFRAALKVASKVVLWLFWVLIVDHTQQCSWLIPGSELRESRLMDLGDPLGYQK